MLKGVFLLVNLYFGGFGSLGFRFFNGISSGRVAGFCAMKVSGPGEALLAGTLGFGRADRISGGGVSEF